MGAPSATLIRELISGGLSPRAARRLAQVITDQGGGVASKPAGLVTALGGTVFDGASDPVPWTGGTTYSGDDIRGDAGNLSPMALSVSPDGNFVVYPEDAINHAFAVSLNGMFTASSGGAQAAKKAHVELRGNDPVSAQECTADSNGTFVVRLQVVDFIYNDNAGYPVGIQVFLNPIDFDDTFVIQWASISAIQLF